MATAEDLGPPPPPEMTPPVAAPAAAAADPIRGPGGAEDQCHDRVAAETGATVNGTNRIEESEAATQIFVNVEGAEEPWVCYVDDTGSIWEVEYSGSEGGA